MNKRNRGGWWTLVLVVGLLGSGCGMLGKSARTPAVVGTWAYVVKNTPQGDAPGTLVITFEDGHLGGRMVVDVLGQTVPLEEARLEGDVFSFVARVNIEGRETPLRGEATLSGDTMTGEVDVEGFGTFAMTATRRMAAPSGG
ncbi:MAG: hypothetical protein KatS3mg044_0840 [Rhodothermaceae bacterium]|nr:MAG: hypothetical protein KatS3mg044_0840 [Rhodothermaceae bacterium]